MALVLDASVGGSGSNSYCTYASASAILLMDVFKTATWASLSTSTASACLVYATMLLDAQIQWDGTKETDAQALRWPRTNAEDVDGYSIDDDTHPIWLQEAVSFYSFFLSQGDRTLDNDPAGFKSLKAGSLAMVIDKYDRIPTIPSIVWAIVKPYGTKMASIPRVLERR